MLPKELMPSVVEERTPDGVIVLTVERRLKGDGEAELKERLDTLVRKGHREIVVDLKHLPNIDSTEMGRLIRSHLSVRQAGGRVRLCNLSAYIVALMKTTRLDTVFELYGTAEEALEAIRRQRLERSWGDA
jgi:anti-sigma B factor antagonist